MIVNCEECGTRYRLDESKIRGSSAKVKCKSCGHVMHITKPEQDAGAQETQSAPAPSGSGFEGGAAASASGAGRASEGGGGSGSAATGQASQSQSTASASSSSQGKSYRGAATSGGRARGMLGIRGKMFFLFVALPIVLSLVTGFVYLKRVERLKNDYGEQISQVVTQMGQSQVAAKARASARQLDLYLSAHPELKAGQLNRDRAVRRMAVQKIGRTGYSFLFQLPGNSNSWNVLVHPNQGMVGSDLTEKQGPSGFQEIIKNTSGGKEASGYYNVSSSGGEQAKRYMFCSPVGNTGYVVAATIKMGSMIQPAQVLNTQLDKTYFRMRNRTLLVLGGLAVFFLLVVAWYGHRLTKRIHTLTDVAERISVGDLEAEVQVKGKDEISSLGEAISRMQESVRLSIERLRRRRS